MTVLKVAGLGTLAALVAWSVATHGDLSSLLGYLITFNGMALAVALGRRHARRHRAR